MSKMKTDNSHMDSAVQFVQTT